MQNGKRAFFTLVSFCLIVLLGIGAVAAQQAVSRIFVTGSNAASAPTIELYAYGVDGQGNVAELAGQSFVVRHDGQPVSDVEVGGTYTGSTFVLFVIDIPPGVAGQLPAIQQAIEQYASEPYMTEQVDSLAIYRVDDVAAVSLLEPTSFYNSVRNLFATPLQTEAGPTALYDSVVGLLNNMEALKPNPAIVPVIVVMTDGTDAVSTARAGDVPARAAELGIPVYTVWLTNTNLQQAGRDLGREYLAQVATGTGGLTADLTNAGQMEAIWQRIASFRNQTVIRYTLPTIAGGTYQVELSLQNNPSVRAQTTVDVPAGAPSIVLNIPPESRALTLQNLDQPVDLSISTTVTWLDGVDRRLSRAQLIVNGLAVQDIDANSIDRFNARIGNFNFGQNRIQVAVVDEAGARAVSPEIVLTINQGATTQVPEEVRPRGFLSTLRQQTANLWRIVGGCLIILFLIGLVALTLWAVRRWSLLNRLGLTSLLRRVPFLRPYMREVAQVQQMGRRAHRVKGQWSRYAPDVRGQSDARGGVAAVATRPKAFLEVLEATTRVSSRVELDALELRLGRSPAQADIAFENDITVSRIHASLVQEGQDYRIFDEQSTSGTWVNEQRVPDYGLQLVDGDEIRLGAVRLRFRQP